LLPPPWRSGLSRATTAFCGRCCLQVAIERAGTGGDRSRQTQPSIGRPAASSRRGAVTRCSGSSVPRWVRHRKALVCTRRRYSSALKSWRPSGSEEMAVRCWNPRSRPGNDLGSGMVRSGSWLVSYGPDFLDQFRRAVGYIDRLLRRETCRYRCRLDPRRQGVETCARQKTASPGFSRE
jgi:hypothetical protein